MVNSFFIALVFAIGSATVLLSILYLSVRILAPRKLDERIPASISIPVSIQEPTVECSSVEQPIFTTTIRALASCDTLPASTLRRLLSGDAIITNVVLPEVSGLKVAEQIKRLSPLGHKVPMFVLTTQHAATAFMGL